MEKLKGKLRGDLEWTDMEIGHPYAFLELNDIAERMNNHGFDVRHIDDGVDIFNPVTGVLECQYRVWQEEMKDDEVA